MVEESQQEFGLEHAAHRRVHLRFGNNSILYLFAQRGKAAIQFKVHAGCQGFARRFGLGAGDVV